MPASGAGGAVGSGGRDASGSGGEGQGRGGAPSSDGGTGNGGGPATGTGGQDGRGTGAVTADGGGSGTRGSGAGGSSTGGSSASGSGSGGTTAKSNGMSCSGAGECGSGHCSAGYCCNVACTGQCESCAVAASRGTCVAVTTPRTPCAGTGTCVGTCNGINGTSCVYPGVETTCAQSSCSGGVAKPAASCNSGGTCSNPAGITCPYGCQPNSTMCAMCRSRSGSNVLSNPGFDTASGTSGWELGGDGTGMWTNNDADGCTGSGSFAFKSIGDTAISECKPATAGRTYHLAYKFKALVALPGSSGDCRIAFYGSCTTNIDIGPELISAPSDGDSWVFTSGSTVAPSGTSNMRVTCGAISGYGYYDQFYLGESDVAF